MNINKPIEIEEVDANLEEFTTAQALVDSLDAMMGRSGKLSLFNTRGGIR